MLMGRNTSSTSPRLVAAFQGLTWRGQRDGQVRLSLHLDGRRRNNTTIIPAIQSPLGEIKEQGDRNL